MQDDESENLVRRINEKWPRKPGRFRNRLIEETGVNFSRQRINSWLKYHGIPITYRDVVRTILAREDEREIEETV